MKILITGVAGFIGFHVTKRLLDEGHYIVGIDNINDYYNVNLKYARLAEQGIYSSDETDFSGGKNRIYPRMEFHKKIISKTYKNYSFYRANLEDKNFIFSLFKEHSFTHVINLAAQAGVRYSIENPDVYVQSNVIGFLNIIEACRAHSITHLIYASSSSVYGANSKIPFSVNDKTDTPVSLYAATKKTNELIAHTYSHIYQIQTTGLRFFTVYGPWGRPDMAPMLFAKAISENRAINVFNNGNMERDFTYVDDIIEGIYRVLFLKKNKDKLYQIFNLGNGKPVNLLDFITSIEKNMGKQATKNYMPIQSGDVEKTWADTQELWDATGFIPNANINDGIKNFIEWYTQFYSLPQTK